MRKEFIERALSTCLQRKISNNSNKHNMPGYG